MPDLSNLPPGLNAGDIPGNREFDRDFEEITGALLEFAACYGREVVDDVLAAVRQVWEDDAADMAISRAEDRKEG